MGSGRVRKGAYTHMFSFSGGSAMPPTRPPAGSSGTRPSPASDNLDPEDDALAVGMACKRQMAQAETGTL